jgi:hypothetical protein
MEIHISNIYSCDKSDNRQKLAKNSNKTFLLMTLIGRYISDYV